MPAYSRYASIQEESSFGTGAGSTYLFDIAGETLQRKLDAMACYTSELRDYPHPRSVRALTERAAYWGSHVGLLAAEPFEVLRLLDRD